MSDQEELSGDAIGDTVYSKQWLLACLRRTIQFAQSESEQSSSLDNENISEEWSTKFSDEIEEQLCLLWDMSANENVQKLLFDTNGHDIFINCIISTNIPRFAEICIGILANIAHNDESGKLYEDNQFCANAISWLSSSDIPFLTQLIRLFNTLITRNQNIWLAVIMENSNTFFGDIHKILNNCLNTDLLKSTLQFINLILYTYDDIGLIWFENDEQDECISCLCQACFQVSPSFDISHDHESNAMSPANCDFFFHFWFIIDTLYEAEYYISKFETHLDDLKELFLRYGHFLNNSTNSLLSYSAACSFFMSVFSLSTGDRLNDHNKLTVTRFKESISSNQTIMQTNKTALAQCANSSCKTDQLLQQVQPNLAEFDLILRHTEVSF